LGPLPLCRSHEGLMIYMLRGGRQWIRRDHVEIQVFVKRKVDDGPGMARNFRCEIFATMHLCLRLPGLYATLNLSFGVPATVSDWCGFAAPRDAKRLGPVNDDEINCEMWQLLYVRLYVCTYIQTRLSRYRYASDYPYRTAYSH
jgi:hypothetical protein